MAPPFQIALLALFTLGLTDALARISAPDHGDYGVRRRETNAERLSRGLPPVRPKRLYNSTRTGPALARRSVQPVTHIIVAYASGSPTPLCYFGNGYVCNADINTAAQFASVDVASPSPQNILVTGPYAPDPLNVEGVSATQGPDVLDDYFVGFYNWAATAPNDTPAYDAAAGTYYESAIWFVASDGTLTANWINPAGSPAGNSVPLTFWTYPAPSPSYNLEATANPSLITSRGGIALTLKFI